MSEKFSIIWSSCWELQKVHQVNISIFQNLHFFISKISVILFPKFQLYNLFTQSLRPDYADGIYNLGDIYSCMGKTEEAIEWMSKAIE